MHQEEFLCQLYLLSAIGNWLLVYRKVPELMAARWLMLMTRQLADASLAEFCQFLNCNGTLDSLCRHLMEGAPEEFLCQLNLTLA